MAAGALELAAQLLGTLLRLGGNGDSGQPWSELVGLQPLDVEAAGRELLDAVCCADAAAAADA